MYLYMFSTFTYSNHNRNFHKVTPFGSFYHPPTFLSNFKHCYPQSNDFFIKYGYEMLEL